MAQACIINHQSPTILPTSVPPVMHGTSTSLGLQPRLWILFSASLKIASPTGCSPVDILLKCFWSPWSRFRNRNLSLSWGSSRQLCQLSKENKKSWKLLWSTNILKMVSYPYSIHLMGILSIGYLERVRYIFKYPSDMPIDTNLILKNLVGCLVMF